MDGCWSSSFSLFAGPRDAGGQTIGTPELKARAMKAFESGNYPSAYEDYMTLLKRYPKDGLFSYYAGVSLLKQHRNLPDAIGYLEFASGKSMVPSDVFYYLGQAYREDYQFTPSVNNFRKFAESADRTSLKELDPAHQSEMSGNAMELTLNYNPFEVYESSLFTFADTNYTRGIKNKGGILSVKPEDLFSKNEKRGELTNFYFRPKNLSKGDYIYFSGYGRSKKKGADIFRVRRTLAQRVGRTRGTGGRQYALR